jgi:hypothetical protein
MAFNLGDFTNGFDEDSSVNKDMPPLIKQEVHNDESEDDDDDIPPPLLPRVYYVSKDPQVYPDSSDDESVPPLLTDNRFNCPSSSSSDNDNFESTFEHAHAAIGPDEVDSKNQIGISAGCGGNGHIGMYCDYCEDQGMIYTKESDASNTSNPERVASNPEEVASAPEKVASAPEKITPAPDIVALAPDTVVLAPDTVVSTPHKATMAQAPNGTIWSSRPAGDEMDEFLREVCIYKHMERDDRQAWIKAVKTKFASMKLTTVCDVIDNLMRLNKMLITYRHTPMT